MVTEVTEREFAGQRLTLTPLNWKTLGLVGWGCNHRQQSLFFPALSKAGPHGGGWLWFGQVLPDLDIKGCFS